MDAPITKALQELFSKWIASDIEKGFLRDRDDKYFVKDGIIDEERWGTKNKILFLLKEPSVPLLTMQEAKLLNIKETLGLKKEYEIPKFISADEWEIITESRSLCTLITIGCKGTKWCLFNAPGRWAYALQNIDNNPLYGTADKQKNDAILYSAIMNIKKTPGGTQCDYKTLLKYVQSDKEYIQEEIRIINPEIIICCGTRYFLQEGKVFNFEEKSPNIYITDEIKGILFIEICHPQAWCWKPNGKEIKRSGANDIYEGLKRDYQEYLKKRNNG